MKLTGKDSNPRKTFYEFAQDTDGCGNNTDTGWLPVSLKTVNDRIISLCIVLLHCLSPTRRTDGSQKGS